MVQNPVLNEQNLYELYGLIHIPWWQTWLFWAYIIIIIAIALSVLSYVGIVYWRKKNRKKEIWDVALLELKALSESSKISNKGFYELLLWIVKKYIEARYAISLQGLTEIEIISLLEQTEDLPKAYLFTLKEMVERAALVKYAHHTVNDSVRILDLENTISFVRHTIPLYIART